MINWPDPSYVGEIYTSPEGYSWVWNGYGWDTLGAEAPNAPIDITYNDFYDLYRGESLLPGRLYRINDFQTVHYILEDSSLPINSGKIEPIYVLATSVSTIDKKVVSETYPQDIIYWDPVPTNWVGDEAFAIPESFSIVPEFKGVITYRKDCSRNIETFYDWRSFVFRRWSINTSAFSAWSSGGTYAVGDLTKDTGGYFYCIESDPSSSVDPHLSNKWVKVTSTGAEYCLAQPYDHVIGVGNPAIFVTLPVDTGEHKDYTCVSQLKGLSNYKEEIRQYTSTTSTLTGYKFAYTCIPNCVTNILGNDIISGIYFSSESYCNTIISKPEGITENISIKESREIILMIDGKSVSRSLDIKFCSGILMIGYQLLTSIEGCELSIIVGNIFNSSVNYTTGVLLLSPGASAGDLLTSSRLDEIGLSIIRGVTIISSRFNGVTSCVIGTTGSQERITYLDLEFIEWLDFSSSTNIYDDGFSKRIMGTTGSPWMLYIDNTGTLQTVLATS